MLGLGANFSCSAIYQATARVQITPPGKVVTGTLQAVANNNEVKPAVSIEMELLNSRPLIEKAADKLRSQGLLKNESNDSVQTLQDMLRLTNVEDTPVVKLQAQGHQKDLDAPLLNTLLDAYQAPQATPTRKPNWQRRKRNSMSSRPKLPKSSAPWKNCVCAPTSFLASVTKTRHWPLRHPRRCGWQNRHHTRQCRRLVHPDAPTAGGGRLGGVQRWPRDPAQRLPGPGRPQPLPTVGDVTAQALRSRVIDPRAKFEAPPDGLFRTLIKRLRDWWASLWAPEPPATLPASSAASTSGNRVRTGTARQSPC